MFLFSESSKISMEIKCLYEDLRSPVEPVPVAGSEGRRDVVLAFGGRAGESKSTSGSSSESWISRIIVT